MGYILSLEFFIASKFEALMARGGDDWRFAHDLEDIILVFDGISDPTLKIKEGNALARNYIQAMITKLIQRPDYEDIINSHIGFHGQERIRSLKNKLNSLLLGLSTDGEDEKD